MRQRRLVKWIRGWRVALPAALVLFVFPPPAGGGDEQRIGAGELPEGTRWKGAYVIEGMVTVPAGTTLKIAEGTRIAFAGETSGITVHGAMEIAGRAGRLVDLVPLGEESPWGGIRVAGNTGPVTLSFTNLRGARNALLVTGGSAVVRGSSFSGNGGAIDAALESTVTVERSSFRENGFAVNVQQQSRLELRHSFFEKNADGAVLFLTGGGGRVEKNTFQGGTAVAVKRGSDIFLGDNTFRDTLVGVTFDEAKQDVRLSGNRFEGGKIGVLCENFATPWVACSEFRNLETGFVATRFSRPLVHHNLFAGNGRGLDANQKSDPALQKNIFRENEIALFVDLSAYPVVNENIFEKNGRDIALGIYMSADWERKVGSRGITAGEASRRGSKNLGGVGQGRDYGGVVDARQNWWGPETTAEMARLGAGGDIGTIDDGFDRPEVTYPEFGEGTYRLDRVSYAPWKEALIADAGPLPGGCGDFEGASVPPRQGEKPQR